MAANKEIKRSTTKKHQGVIAYALSYDIHLYTYRNKPGPAFNLSAIQVRLIVHINHSGLTSILTNEKKLFSSDRVHVFFIFTG